MANNFLSVGGKHTEKYTWCRAAGGKLDCFHTGLSRTNVPGFIEDHTFPCSHDHAKLLKSFRSQHTNLQFTSLHFNVYGSQPIGIFGGPNFLNGVPILAERACFERLKPRKIRLVIREDAGHQLHIRSIGIGELAVPHVPELRVSPRPQLLAG